MVVYVVVELAPDTGKGTLNGQKAMEGGQSGIRKLMVWDGPSFPCYGWSGVRGCSLSSLGPQSVDGCKLPQSLEVGSLH
jgi:hypothetical protein